MVYSISASLYYSTISTLLDYAIFQSISYLERLKKLDFIGSFDFFRNLGINQSKRSKNVDFTNFFNIKKTKNTVKPIPFQI